MSERGTRLMAKADGQLSEMIEFFGTLNEVDLHKPYPDESTEDSAGDTVGAVAAHMAQGYHFLGKFLQADGYVLGSPATGNRKGSGHRYRPGHGRTGRRSTRRIPRWVMVFGIILVKLGVIALLLVLPFGLAISLGAAHGVALLVLLVVAAVTLLVYKLRGRTLSPALSHRPSRGHRLILGWWSAKVARIFNKGRK